MSQMSCDFFYRVSQLFVLFLFFLPYIKSLAVRIANLKRGLFLDLKDGLNNKMLNAHINNYDPYWREHFAIS